MRAVGEEIVVGDTRTRGALLCSAKHCRNGLGRKDEIYVCMNTNCSDASDVQSAAMHRLRARIYLITVDYLLHISFLL